MPRAPKHCGHPGCDEPTRTTYCPGHTPRAWAGAGRGSTRAWRTLRRQVLDEEPWCRDHLEHGAKVRSTEAGHIVARAHGGPDERANLKGQCTACNLEQLARDRAR